MQKGEELEAREARTRAHMEKDYLPISMGAAVSAENRVASALEYIAHHMGKISRNLDRIAEKLDAKD